MGFDIFDKKPLNVLFYHFFIDEISMQHNITKHFQVIRHG